MLERWRCGKNTRCPLSLVAILKNLYLFCSTPRQSLLSFLKKSRKTFLQYLSYKKKEIFVHHIGNLTQHLSEKSIGDDLSFTDIA